MLKIGLNVSTQKKGTLTKNIPLKYNTYYTKSKPLTKKYIKTHSYLNYRSVFF